MDLVAIIPFFMSSLLSGLFWNSWLGNVKTINQDFKACKWSTRLATWFVWSVFSPIKMVLKSLFRSGFCEFSGSSRWSGTSPDFKVWSTLSTKLGKSSGSSWSSLASFSWCSQALSTLLNKTDQMRTSGMTKKNGQECSCCIKQTFLFNRKFYDCILWSALTVTTVGYNLQPEVSRWSTIYCQTSQYVFDLLLEHDACPGSHSPPSRAWVSWRAGKSDKKVTRVTY